MAEPPAIPESTGLAAFKFGSQSASEYLEALYARAEVEKIQMREKMNKRHRRKPRPMSEDDSTLDDGTNLDATPEEDNTKRDRTRGGRAQMEGLSQQDDIKAAVGSPADHHLPEPSADPVEVPRAERRATQPMTSAQCSNCHTSSTPKWRKDGAGNVLCNACGIYFKTHGRRLPIARRDSTPDLSRSTMTRGADANSEPDADAHPNKRRRINHIADPLQNAPDTTDESTQSEAATTSTSISRESSLTPLPPDLPVHLSQRVHPANAPHPICAHCHSTKSSNGSWRASTLGGAGPFCNACLQYERMHARRRPLELVRYHQARRGRGG
ncbi:hypothetical protein C8R44DRAFT_972639 [Mycena epipterygia]|nr:hypothetical protein C8R44DRAFT_972639 [Mycena epipterygia]